MGGMAQELSIITRAYNQAQQGLQSTAQSLGRVQQAADQTAAASNRLNQAFGTAMKQTDGYKQSANGLFLPLNQVAEANKRAAAEAQKAGQAAGQAGKGFKEQKDEAKGAGDALQEFYQTLGALGFLRGFQIAVRGIVAQTREYGASITQASLISEDYTGALDRAAMAATRGMYGPQELAQVYRDLGSAGLAANDVLAASPEVLRFATAAMIDQADAAQAVIAAASSFQIPFSQADKITDAFAEAMNRTTLGGRDLVYALASIGPVAGMAGQGLGQTLAAVAALRNAGAHAQDAATSVRAAMLHLSAPSTEAAGLIDKLGIKIFDASGNMKQWSEIVAEFERALAPYNQQARTMALTTIMGSDGIRAMASSMQMGSGHLAELAGQFDNADGSAKRMADAMSETLDGAMRRLSGNTQRAAIAIGSDLQPAIVSVIGFLDKLVNGFLHLDKGTRTVIELILGGAGLVTALVAVARAVQTLSGLGSVVTFLKGVSGAATATTAAATGATAAFGGVAGIVGLVATALGIGYLAWRTYHAGQEQATLAGADHAEQLKSQADRLRELRRELETLAAKTTPTADEQTRLKQVAGEIAKIAPEAALGINQMTGEVTNLGAALQGTNIALDRMLQQSQTLTKAAASASAARLPKLRAEAADLQRQVAEQQGQIDAGKLPFVSPGGKFVTPPQDRNEVRATQGGELLQLIKKLAASQQEIAEAEALLTRTNAVVNGPHEMTALDEMAAQRRYQRAQAIAGSSGGLDASGLGTGDKPPTWISTFKAGLQETMTALDPFKSALSGVGGELDTLNAKQTYYLAMLSDGRAGVEALAGAENARTQILTQLYAQQTALHQSNDANRAMLTTLAAKQAALDAQFDAGTVKANDYADASAALRTETERLTASIYQNSAAWWRDEQSIADAEATAGKAQQTLREAQTKIADQAYQSATAAMRHEVAMKKLSVDQQIALLRQMLKEMTLSTEQASALQEQIIGVYGQKIQKEADKIQTAYSDAMDKVSADLDGKLDGIDKRLKSTIDPLKKQLKDLEDQNRTTDRTRAEAEHNRELKELQKERNKEALRLGADHKAALERIDAQIAEKNLRWQQQQDDWKLDDQKRGIQEKIDTAEQGAKDERDKAQDAAKAQRRDLEAHYKEVKRITESGILDTIATLAATDPQWFSTGEGMIGQLIAGLKTGDFTAVLATINTVTTAAQAAMQAAQQAVTAALPSTTPGGSPVPGLSAMDQAKAMAASGQYEQAARLLSQFYGMTYDDAKKNIENFLGRDIPGFAKGAWEINTDGLLAQLHQGETVLPAYAAEAFRNFAPSIAGLPAAIESMAERMIAAIQSRPAGDVRVYGAENAYLDDPVDVDMLGRGVARQITKLVPTPTGG
jgi:TP901 family phage tail tape measure protein